jgi:polar amino acid transport system substrate-binding protein
MGAFTNRSRRAWLACLLLAFTTTSTIVPAQASRLRLVSTAWPPFTNRVGQPRFALDLVEEALTRIGVSSTTTIVEPVQFTPSLLKGDFDGSAAAWKDADRERVLLFSQPYLENRLILVGRSGADVSAPTLAALAGRRIAIVEGYAYGEAVNQAGPVFVRSRGEEDSVARLLKGDVEYALMDDLVVQYIVDQYPTEAQARLQLGTTPLVTRPLFFAIRRTHPDAQSIVDRFNAQLRGMITDRTYHRLLHVDWIQADVDGDGLLEYVPRSDKAGAREPPRAYSLFSTTQMQLPTLSPSQPVKPSSETKRFYFGGNIYENWATVPDPYKLSAGDIPNPARSTASIFRFAW